VTIHGGIFPAGLASIGTGKPWFRLPVAPGMGDACCAGGPKARRSPSQILESGECRFVRESPYDGL
jgi:hypothetical protein